MCLCARSTSEQNELNLEGELEAGWMLDAARRDFGSLDLLKGNGAGNETKGRQRHYRCYDHNVGAAAETAVA
jgi:hypothetical protein